MHPVLKGLGIVDRAISFIMDSSNGNKVKSNCDQGSLAKAPMTTDPLPVDAAKERQPGVHGGGLRCTCANGVRKVLVSWWGFWPRVSAAACWSLPQPLNETLLIVSHFLTAHRRQWEEGKVDLRRLRAIHLNQQVFTELIESHLLLATAGSHSTLT